MSVSRALFRLWRPIILCFAGVMLAVELVFVGLLVWFGQPRFSPWLVMTVPASKYWLIVAGIVLVVMYLRQFVANGVTRHEFLAGVAVFLLGLGVAFALAVVLGHAVESAVLGLAGERASGYPVASLRSLPGELGQVLPGTLAYPVTGALIAAGFYRWRAWAALVVMAAASAPIVVSDALLGIDEAGHTIDRLPFAASLALSFGVTALAAAAFHRAISDVAIKRTAG